MTHPLIMIHGDKGGVGKSTVAQAMLHFLPTGKCLDGDVRNSDVARSIGDDALCYDLKTSAGWIDLINAIESMDTAMVVSLPAGCGAELETQMHTLMSVVQHTQMSPIVVWVSNSQRDSVTLLREYWTTRDHRVPVVNVLNGYFAPRASFSLWDGSSFKREFMAFGGKEVYWPTLHTRVSDIVSREALTYTEALASSSLRLGERAALQQYLTQCDTICAAVVGGCV